MQQERHNTISVKSNTSSLFFKNVKKLMENPFYLICTFIRFLLILLWRLEDDLSPTSGGGFSRLRMAGRNHSVEI